MKIAILDFVDLPLELGGGPIATQLIADWLSPALPEATLSVVNVAGGDSLPAPGAFDGFVLGGSEKGVYDSTPWMRPLRQWLLDIRVLRAPVFGICFGHQIMADTYGGKAGLVDQGMVVGTRRFTVQGEAVQTYVWHQDQVTKSPPGARSLGGADYCPMGVLAYDFPALSVQFHPEFTRDFMTRTIADCAGSYIAADLAETAAQSVHNGDVAPDLMAAEAAGVLRGANGR